jgi:hypothetical protein
MESFLTRYETGFTNTLVVEANKVRVLLGNNIDNLDKFVLDMADKGYFGFEIFKHRSLTNTLMVKVIETWKKIILEKTNCDLTFVGDTLVIIPNHSVLDDQIDQDQYMRLSVALPITSHFGENTETGIRISYYWPHCPLHEFETYFNEQKTEV